MNVIHDPQSDTVLHKTAALKRGSWREKQVMQLIVRKYIDTTKVKK
jgi:hypothetical protein